MSLLLVLLLTVLGVLVVGVSTGPEYSCTHLDMTGPGHTGHCSCSNLGVALDISCSNSTLSHVDQVLARVLPRTPIILTIRDAPQLHTLKRIAAFSPHSIFRVSVEECGVSEIEADALRGLEQVLEELRITGNRLEEVPGRLLRGMARLQHVDLSGNRLARVDVHMFSAVADTLDKLNLSSNRLVKVPTDALRTLANLKWLDLSNNSISEVSPDSFVGLTLALHYLSLSHNLLTEVPSDAIQHLRQLEELSLAYNYIRYVPSSAFERVKSTLTDLSLAGNPLGHVPTPALSILAHLQSLDLSDTELRHIRDDAFLGLTQLRQLKLSSNFLLSYPVDALRPLPALEWLDVSHNQLRSVPGDAFLMLVYLDLDGNRLTEFPSAPFYQPTNLVRLHLAHNRIEQLRGPVLPSGTKLWHLDLSSNGLHRIHPRSFSNLETCHGGGLKLYLHNNSISRLDPDSFQNSTLYLLNLGRNHIGPRVEPGLFYHLHGLRHLDLCENRVEVVADDSFLDLPSLRYLDLSHNRITQVSGGALTSIANVSHLILSHNHLRELTGSHISPLTQLQELLVDGNQLSHIPSSLYLSPPTTHVDAVALWDNPWECSCRNRLLKVWIEDEPQITNYGEGVTCASPPPVNGSLVRDLDWSWFVCAAGETGPNGSGPGRPQHTGSGGEVRARWQVVVVTVILVLAWC